MSTLHSIEFYKNNCLLLFNLVKEKAVETVTFEIPKITNFSEFDEVEFKSHFAKNKLITLNLEYIFIILIWFQNI